MADQLASLLGSGCHPCGCRPWGCGRRDPARSAAKPMPLSGRPEVLLDVDGQGPQRREVDHPGALLRRRRATGSTASRSRAQRNADRVLPVPVGARMSVWSPSAIAGQPVICGGVGAWKVEVNHSRTGSENRRGRPPRHGSRNRGRRHPWGHATDAEGHRPVGVPGRKIGSRHRLGACPSTSRPSGTPRSRSTARRSSSSTKTTSTSSRRASPNGSTCPAPAVSEMVKRMEAEGLIESGRQVTLTAGGPRSSPKTVVRRHRLAECFLTDILGLSWADAHQEAGQVGTRDLTDGRGGDDGPARRPDHLPPRQPDPRQRLRGAQPRDPRLHRRSATTSPCTASPRSSSSSRACSTSSSVVDHAGLQGSPHRDVTRRHDHRRDRGHHGRRRRVRHRPHPGDHRLNRAVADGHRGDGRTDDQDPGQHGRDGQQDRATSSAALGEGAALHRRSRSPWPACRKPVGREQHGGRELLHRRQHHEPGPGQQPGGHERQVDREEPTDPAGPERARRHRRAGQGHRADGHLRGPGRLGTEVEHVGEDQQRERLVPALDDRRVDRPRRRSTGR